MPTLSDDDLKFVLSVDPDDEALNKAVNQINDEINRAQASMQKIALEMDPQFLQERIRMERRVQSEKRKLSDAEQREQVKQAGGPFGYITEQLGGLFGGGGGGGTAGLLAGILGGQGGGGMLGQLGGIIGGAFGGPAGAVIGGEIAEALPKVLAAPMKVVTAGAQAFASSLQELQGTLGPAGLPFLITETFGKAIQGAVEKIPIAGELLGPLVEQFVMLPGVLKEVTTSLTMMSEKASPATLKLFTFAVEDAQATIGQAFIPVVNMMREGVELFADVMANLIPSTTEVTNALSGVNRAWQEIQAELRSLAADLGPMIRTEILHILQSMTMSFRLLAAELRLVNMVMGPFLQSINRILQSLGLVGDTDPRVRTTAARTPTLGGIEEYQRQLQLQTAAGPGTGADSVPQGVNSLVRMVENIEKWFVEVGKPERIVEMVAKGVSGLLPKGVRESIEAANNNLDALRRRAGGAGGAIGGGAGV